jgi:hypothetical protein
VSDPRIGFGDRRAIFSLDGWAGRREHKCYVVGETPTRYRIAIRDQPLKLRGGRMLFGGQTALVPKRSVRFESPGDQ